MLCNLYLWILDILCMYKMSKATLYFSYTEQISDKYIVTKAIVLSSLKNANKGTKLQEIMQNFRDFEVW